MPRLAPNRSGVSSSVWRGGLRHHRRALAHARGRAHKGAGTVSDKIVLPHTLVAPQKKIERVRAAWLPLENFRREVAVAAPLQWRDCSMVGVPLSYYVTSGPLPWRLICSLPIGMGRRQEAKSEAPNQRGRHLASPLRRASLVDEVGDLYRFHHISGRFATVSQSAVVNSPFRMTSAAPGQLSAKQSGFANKHGTLDQSELN